MKFETRKLGELVINFDRKRVPLSSRQRSERQGVYPYYGATSIMDYVDDYIFDGKYLLMGEDGTVIDENGKPILQIAEGKFWCNNHAHILQNTELVTFDYLYYLLKNTNVQSLVTGAVQPKISQSNMNKLVLRIHKNKKEQEKIARYLRLLDDKIELNSAINNNLLQQLDTLYDEFSHRKNWSTVIINDIAEKVAMGPFGSNIKVSTFVSKGIPIISGNHLRGYFLEEPSFNYITEEHAQRLKNSLVYPKDIVFTHAGNIGQVAMIPDDCRYPMYVLSQRQFYLRCNTEKAIPEYVVLFFHSKQGQHELLSYANQTGVPSIAQPATNLKKIPLKLPPIDEQRQWLQVVSPIIKLYQSNVYENEHLSSMRDSLLPKLMSGELDVSDIDL